jgi:hypothetical protein
VILIEIREAYLDKFKTNARCRPTNEKILGQEFFELEHSEPLLNQKNILTVYSQYSCHITMTAFKILKLYVPISLYSCFALSNRKETLLLYQKTSESYIFKASSIWNTFKSFPEAAEITDFYIGVGALNARIKAAVLRCQKLGTLTNQTQILTLNFCQIRKLYLPLEHRNTC